jgi:DNA-binding SARP family transcriptional activator
LVFILDKGEVTQEVLMETFWPHVSLRNQRASAHSALYAIRKVLGRGVIVRKGDVLAGGVESPPEIDVHEFEASARKAVQDRHLGTSLLGRLESILQLYKGPFLPGVTRQWVIDRRRELEALFLQLAFSYGSECLRQSRADQGVAIVTKAIELDPFDEGLRILASKLLVASGRQAHALHVLAEYRELLKAEFNLTPLAEFTMMERSIMEGTSSLFFNLSRYNGTEVASVEATDNPLNATET